MSHCGRSRRDAAGVVTVPTALRLPVAAVASVARSAVDRYARKAYSDRHRCRYCYRARPAVGLAGSCLFFSFFFFFPPFIYPPTLSQRAGRRRRLRRIEIFSAKLFCMRLSKNRLTPTKRSGQGARLWLPWIADPSDRPSYLCHLIHSHHLYFLSIWLVSHSSFRLYSRFILEPSTLCPYL